MSCYYIIAIRLKNRTHNALGLQDCLTKYGCNIGTRLGLHCIGDNVCTNDGMIILQLCCNKDAVDEMVNAFNSLEGVMAKMIDLN